MSDDDQDKTRIQPRLRKKPQPVDSRPATGSDADFVSAPGQVKTEASKRAFAKTRSQADSVTETREGAAGARPQDMLKNRFVLDKVLGAGGMGVVYKAKDLLKVEAQDRDPWVAIKVLGEEFKSHPEAFIALQRESRKTQRIAHPNIVNVYDFDKDENTVFMTMEFLEGTPLDKLVKKYRGTGLPRDDVWPILEGICSALAYAHDQRLIHSDLKPGNIFVTNAGIAKVFDFGIARAVAKAEQGDSTEPEDRTVFDAGNLGALTPAYASLEMLEGDPPDIRDDIYALGCIAYELLTGNHPFGRKNAKEAFRKGYKPERIKNISKAQWKAIEGALALLRENRTGTVDEFWEQFNAKSVSGVRIAAAGVALAVIFGAGVATQFWPKEPPPPAEPQISEDEVRSEIESKIRLELIQQNLAGLFDSLSFDSRWESSLRQQLEQLEVMLGAEHELVSSAKGKAYSEYIAKIEQAIADKQFDQARRWIRSARPYSPDNGGDLAALEQQVEQTLAAIEKQKQEELRKQREAEAAAAAARKKAQAASASSRQYDTALAGLNEQLECNRLLDMNAFAADISKMRSVDSARYSRAEVGIVERLAACINRIARNFPEQGVAAQKAAAGIFAGNPTFKATAAVKNDSCRTALAGLGSRGRRSRCQDVLASGGKGPQTVVIPGSGSVETFAIGRYEVSIEEFNQFCKASGQCAARGGNDNLPITNVAASSVEDYLQWLSEQTGSSYRLPTLDEWQHAASARGRELDANRNCKLDIRGIQKGGSLVNAGIGQQNGWGLVNYVGNAREWVTNGQQLVAVGGSYNTEMQECTLDNSVATNGQADAETGFRVARELQ